MMRRLLALMLCICMIGSMTVYAVGDETEPVVDDTAIVDDAVVEEPTVEEPTVEEPTVEEPTVEPVVEDLVQKPGEETSSENLIVEEPTRVIDAAFAEAMYNDLMSCETAEAANALTAELSNEDIEKVFALLTQEQVSALDAHFAILYAPEIIEDIPSAVNFTKAAPFRAPVEGATKLRLLRAAAEEENEGMDLSKTVSEPDENGQYTITLEAFATGEKTITPSETAIPTDIILVLDQSGSMNCCMYENCTDQSCRGQHRVTEYTYTETFSVSSGNTYYFKSGNNYQRAYYCSGNSWRGCDGGWFTTQHGMSHGGTPLTPKTSATSEGTQFYTATGTTTTKNFSIRLDALKSGVTTFANQVTEKAKGADGVLGTDDDVNHRIAVVGFSGTSSRYTNTELFIGATQYGYNNAASYYDEAFQNMNTTAGQTNITASIGALDADGSTYVHHGLELANGILNANPVASGEKRNRVIVVFTDGVPGYSTTWSDDSKSTGEAAIRQAQTAKNAGVTVYGVGIFAGADPTIAGNWADSASTYEKANYYMQNMSSNNGVPQNPSYYLAANNADALNSIFKSIAENIESGGSSITLDEQAIVRDIISDQFQLPASADADDIKVYTADYTAEDTFAESVEFDATVTVSDDGKTISVNNFDFAEYWVGTETGVDGTVTYRGKKLIIEIPVMERTGFLGGNNVPTNEFAGVYEDADAEEPLFTFEAPELNVPIKDITVEAPEQNVYLLGDVSKDVLDDGTVTVGDVTLDLDAENYGLEPWQYEYVNIAHTVTDSEGNVITADFADLTDDKTYTVTVTVTPEADGEGAVGDPAVEKSGNAVGKINVFKPELTFADSTVYYGDAAPADYSGNLTSTEWKHNGTAAPAAMGAAPALTVDCTPDAAKIVDGKIGSKQDISVDAAIKQDDVVVTDYTTFVHTVCSGDCSWNVTTPDGTPAFLLHVKTCQLTVTKTGGASGESYVFTVKKDGNKYTEVTIVGNDSVTIYELPVGTYSITEDTGWSWRYTSSVSANVALSSNKTEGAITCTNTLKDNTLLNGYSDVIANIFGVKH